MSRNEISLSHFDTFGDVAAEDDAVLEYFLSTNAVDKIKSNESFLVLGRKGTGKTAIVRHFTENGGVASRALNLRGYPWNVHASRIDGGASEIEAYVSSWRYLIAVELASLALSQPEAWRSNCVSSLDAFLKENYGGNNPRLEDILRPKRLKLSKISFMPSIMGNQIGGVDLERGGQNHQLGLELDALSLSIMDAVQDVLRWSSSSSLSLHFDELDQGITILDDSRSKMLIGLIIAAREIKRESEKAGNSINPVVYLRTDLWDEFQFSDKNKISQTLTLNLEWNSESLLSLVEERLRAKLGAEAKWDSIIEPELMRGSQPKWNHILSRTFLRPRDVIRFLNGALREAKKRSVDGRVLFVNKDIVNSREGYSSYLKQELDDEIRPHWPQWAEALRACSAISTVTFERDEFEREYMERKSDSNGINAEEALSLLYRFSVIGYQSRSGYGGSSWVFQYTDQQAGWDNAAKNFKVHSGLKEYAKLRETRA
jgi:hypothetical protein